MSQSKKYNRTFHLPWSAGCTNDDKIAKSVDSLIGVPIIITEKMDGSNVSLERDGCFARTHAGPPTHPSFDQLKALHASLRLTIPQNFQLFGEWCYAKHSIEYTALPNYFMLFGARHLISDKDDFPILYWNPWADIEHISKNMGLPTVPVIYGNIVVFSEIELKKFTDNAMSQPSACGGIMEGVVVRLASGFDDDQFPESIMKCVRANHVDPNNDHWKHQVITKNKLKTP